MMRFVLLAAACGALAACSGSDTGPAGNGQANDSNKVSLPPSAEPLSRADFSPVSGEGAKSVMHERHEGMEAIGKSTKAIRRELERDSPDLEVVRSSANKMEELAAKASGWFRSGTGPDVAKTGAKPEIWRNQDDFVAKLTAFQKAAVSFHRVAAGNDVNAIKASFGKLGQTCKACHDKYRSEMKH